MGSYGGNILMFLESLLGLSGCYIAYRINNKDDISNRKQRKIIENKWSKLMDAIGTKAENKIKQEYKILKVIPMHYGFDAIISLPIGVDCNKFRELIPSIQQTYIAEVIAEPSKEKKNTIYMRVHDVKKSISEKDRIRFSWYKYFHSGNKFRNSFGETYTIESISPIKDLNKDDVGYKLSISIPSQLKYSDLDASCDDLSKVLSKCFITYNNETKKVNCNVITKPIDNNYKFTPIKKLKAWQLYIGMGYDYKPIILDYKVIPNCLIGGVVGSGKTVSLIMAFVNLCITRDDFDLHIGMMSEKEDLRIFQNVKQCKSYCEKYEFFNEEGLIPQDKPLAIDMFTEAIKIEMANQLEVFRDEIKKDIRNEMKDLLMAQYQANDELKQSICVSIDELVDEKLTNQMNEIVKLQKEELRSTTKALNEVNMQLKELKETAYVTAEEIKRQKQESPNRWWKWFTGVK